MNEYITKKGYYIGNINELDIDHQEFNDNISFVKNLYETRDEYYSYRHCCEESSGLPHRISMKEKEERINFVKENNIDVWQRWAELTPITKEIENSITTFRKIWVKYLPTIYPELTVDNMHFSDSITLYENDDFINWHQDGTQKGRVCGVLLYLSDESEYNDGGGKFMIENQIKEIPSYLDRLQLQQNYEEVIPIKGNFVILDFKRHDLRHAVQKVKNNFKRYCYLAFVYNKDITESTL